MMDGMAGMPIRTRKGWVLRMVSAAVAAAAAAGCGSLDSSKESEPRAGLLDLRLTEIHYHPADQDTVPGDEYEFIEIKNTGAAALDLDDVVFSAGVTYAFPAGSRLEPGAFWVIAASSARFRARYGFAPDGEYSGGLSNSGEKVALEDAPAHSVIDEVTYGDGKPWPASADGGGYSLVPVSGARTAGAAGWRPSFRIGGSPGKDDLGAVVINEVLSHTDPPVLDAIELYNTESTPADIGGWWLSDDSADAAKFRIPPGTVIPPGGYVYFDEGDFNTDSASDRSFRLGSHGDDVWLSADPGGCAKGYCDGVAFGEMPNGYTIGRYIAGDGSPHFAIQKKTTLGLANAGPRIGPAILTEIMYHSPNDTDDYLELANIGGQPLDLFDPNRPANTWKIEGLGFRFPAGVTLAPGEIVLVLPVRASEERIRVVYSVPAGVRVFQSEGDLRNGSETLALAKPEDPYVKEGAAPADSTVPYQIIDQVSYRDGGAWPGSADGEGKALARKSKDAFGDDPTSWSAAAPGPGK
jgi:hypothetical protein